MQKYQKMVPSVFRRHHLGILNEHDSAKSFAGNYLSAIFKKAFCLNVQDTLIDIISMY